LQRDAAATLSTEGVTASEQQISYEIDIRYIGQGMKLTVPITPAELASEGIAGVAARFDREHEQLFTFALDAEHELVGLRAVVQGAESSFVSNQSSQGGASADSAKVQATRVFADGNWHEAAIYDRAKLARRGRIAGPAIVVEMDSTSLILPGHTAVVDNTGNLLIWPNDHADLNRAGQQTGAR